MGKKSPSPPPAPDYAAAAQQQGQANLEAARLTARLSNPNVITPLGGQRVTYGRPQFNMNAYNAAMADWRARNPQAQTPTGGTTPTTGAPTAPTTGTTTAPPTISMGGGMYGPTTEAQPLTNAQMGISGWEAPGSLERLKRQFNEQFTSSGGTTGTAPVQAGESKQTATTGEMSDREYAYGGPGAQTRAAQQQMFTTSAGNRVPTGLMTDYGLGGGRLDTSGMGPGAATRAAQGYGGYGGYGAYTGDVMPTPEMFTDMVDLDTPTIEQYLTPEAQATLEAQQRVERALSGLGEQAIGRVSNIYNTTFNPQGLADRVNQLQGFGPLPSIGPLEGRATADIGAMPVNYGPTGGQFGMAQGGPTAPNLQGRLDTSNLAAMPVNAGTTAQEAILSRLDPSLQRQRAQLETQLVNQGLARGGEAYNAAMQEQGQRENDLRMQAALQGINVDMAARQQGLGEAQALGGFANQSALAGFGAGQQSTAAQNAAIAQNFGQALQGQGAYNAAAAQQFGQGMDVQNARNAALSQNQQAALQQAQAQAALQAQGFNQAQAMAAFQNAQRQAALQEQLALRAQPLNEIAAIMGGAQVQMPQFQAYQGAEVGAAPIFGATQAAGQFAQQNYANQVAAQNARLGMYGQLGGALGSAIGGGGISGLFR